MDANSYNEFVKKGDKAQELLVSFMESAYDREFVAGDRNGKTLNIDLIEELARCSYIAPNTIPGVRHGPKLAFFGRGSKDGYVMPDELFLVKTSSDYEFVDVKNRSKNTLKEKYWKIRDYAKINEYSGIDTYVAVVIWNSRQQGFDIFIRKASDILKDNGDKDEQEDAEFHLSKFEKLNNVAIDPDQYQ